MVSQRTYNCHKSGVRHSSFKGWYSKVSLHNKMTERCDLHSYVKQFSNHNVNLKKNQASTRIGSMSLTLPARCSTENSFFREILPNCLLEGDHKKLVFNH